MTAPTYRWINRLIDRITSVNQSNNDTFTFFGHNVTLLSGTRDYVDVTVNETSDLYSQTIAEFTFDFWTKELVIGHCKDDKLEEVIISAYKRIYTNIKIINTDYEN